MHVVCACVSCQGSVPIIRSFICEKVPARSAAPAERGHAQPRLPFPKLKIRKTPSIIAHFFRWEQLNCLPLYCLHAVVHDRVSLSSCLVSPAHLPRFPTHYPLSSQPLSLLACPPGVIPLQSRASGVHCLVQCWCTTAAAPTAVLLPRPPHPPLTLPPHPHHPLRSRGRCGRHCGRRTSVADAPPPHATPK